jgi:uncharacterized membrane protein
MKQLLTVVAWCLIAAYPLIVFYGLQRLPMHYLGVLLVGLGLVRLVSVRAPQGGALLQYLLAIVLILVVLNAVVADNPNGFKFYPVVVNLVMLSVFLFSLYRGQPMIERFARLAEPDLPLSAIPYTRKVTIVWCVFFLCNGAMALYTAIAASFEVWVWYNGVLAYLIMGILFGVEWLVRRRVRRTNNARVN